MEVYKKVLREKGMKVVATKWVDINKGSEAEPNYRCRLVAKHFNRWRDHEMFSATPPRELFKFFLSMQRTRRG